MQIKNKREFYKLWEEGLLGNRTKIFHTLEEALESREPQIGFRQVGKAGGGRWSLVKKENQPRDQFIAKVTIEYQIWKNLGTPFIMDNSVPNHRSTLQGEICRTYKGIESFLAVGYGLPPMRISIQENLHVHRGGATTNYLLDKYMDPSSRDDLRDLLDLYPDAAIEFTCFDCNVGVLPHRNTIFWEIRNY